jgi:hypothetical protein
MGSLAAIVHVMAVLVARIHTLMAMQEWKAWMAGTSPAMTSEKHHRRDLSSSGTA